MSKTNPLPGALKELRASNTLKNSMLIEYDELKKEFERNLPKLEKIIEIRENLPDEYRKNTEHLASVSALFSYVYHSALVKKYFSQRNMAKILDWGSFLGQVTYLLQDDYDICAHNPRNSDIIDFWHDKLCIKNKVCENYENIGSSCNSVRQSSDYDAILSSGVLEHTFEFAVDDVEALKRINSLLKDSGKLFIWHLPAKMAFAERLSEKKKRWRHILRYDLSDILVKLSMTGFSVLEIERSELLFDKLAILFPLKTMPTAWRLDLYLGKLPYLHSLTHHYTIVAEKVKNFPNEPCNHNYNVYA